MRSGSNGRCLESARPALRSLVGRLRIGFAGRQIIVRDSNAVCEALKLLAGTIGGSHQRAIAANVPRSSIGWPHDPPHCSVVRLSDKSLRGLRLPGERKPPNLFFDSSGEAPAEHTALDLFGLLASRGFDSRLGWSRHTIGPGDKVSIAFYLLKDHRPGGFYVGIKLPNDPMM